MLQDTSGMRHLILTRCGVRSFLRRLPHPLRSSTFRQFFDSKFVTRGEGREVTRVRKSGTVKVSLDVLTRGKRFISQLLHLGGQDNNVV